MIKVLIVDDDERIHILLKGFLATYDVETISAVDGEEAVEFALKEKPDLILLDYVMPGLDGIKVMKAFEFACEKMRAIIISGHDIMMIKNKLNENQNVVGYVSKPFDFEALTKLIDSVIEDVEAEKKA